MRKIILIILISFVSNFVWSQIVFNRIVEDTVAHITNSVIALDTGYVILSGTNNEDLVRCYSLRFVDSEGNLQWKKVFGDSVDEYWEGRENCFKKAENGYYMSGNIHKENSELHIFINAFDSLFNLSNTHLLLQDTVWKKSFNICKSSNGDYYITGQIVDQEAENTYLLLLKTDSLGNFLWKKTYGQRLEFGLKILETSDNSILVGGSTFSYPTISTDQDWYLLKVDTAGTIIWENGFGNSSINDGAISGIIETQDSNYIACGSYPAFEAAGNNFYDGCLRKISKDGNLIWTKYIRSYSFYPTEGPTTINCKVTSILGISNGDIMIIGNSYESYPRHRGFLTRLDSNGYIKWHRLYYAESENSVWQYFSALKSTKDKGFIIAGYGNEYDEFGYNPPQQAWLVKTDSLGLDGLCNTEIPELNFDIEFPQSICRNDTIEVYAYIAGKSAPYTIEFSSGQLIDSIFYPPLFVPVEIGLSETSVQVGGIEYYSEMITEATLSNHEWGQCIAKPIEYYSPSYAGDITIQITVTDAYGESKTISKNINIIDCDDLVEQENVCPVKLYPNPAIDKVYVDIPKEIAAVSAEIYNSAGQLIKTVNVHNGLNVVDVSDFASGNYILKITSANENYSLSFEKE